jgi:hypothetical protein
LLRVAGDELNPAMVAVFVNGTEYDAALEIGAMDA